MRGGGGGFRKEERGLTVTQKPNFVEFNRSTVLLASVNEDVTDIIDTQYQI